VCIAADSCDVFVWWESCGHIFSVTSHSYGESFGQVKRRSCDRCIKALHIGCFNVTELLVSESGEIYAPEEVRELTEQYVAEKTIQKEENKKYAKKDDELLLLRAELAQKDKEIKRLTNMSKIKNGERFSK
jgi:hypothetical protein